MLELLELVLELEQQDALELFRFLFNAFKLFLSPSEEEEIGFARAYSGVKPSSGTCLQITFFPLTPWWPVLPQRLHFFVPFPTLFTFRGLPVGSFSWMGVINYHVKVLVFGRIPSLCVS